MFWSPCIGWVLYWEGKGEWQGCPDCSKSLNWLKCENILVLYLSAFLEKPKSDTWEVSPLDLDDLQHLGFEMWLLYYRICKCQYLLESLPLPSVLLCFQNVVDITNMAQMILFLFICSARWLISYLPLPQYSRQQRSCRWIRRPSQNSRDCPHIGSASPSYKYCFVFVFGSNQYLYLYLWTNLQDKKMWLSPY